MQYKQLGRTGLQVSALCLGTANFGWMSDERESIAVMERALDAGINLFDTANSYNHQQGENSTEHIIGRWLKQGSGKREKIILATKVYATLSSWPNDGKLSARHIKQACEGSLRRLQTDYIDLYQMHHIDRNAAWEEVWQAMEQLVREGKIIYVGSCNFAGWHIATANAIAKQRNFMGLVSEQSVYNLTQRQIELEVIPACQAYGLGLFPYSPLAGGLLGCAIKGATEGRRSLPEVQQHSAGLDQQLGRFQALCEDLDEEPAVVALAWLLHQPGVTAPIVGSRTPAQLEGTLRALNLTLTEETLAKLDAIWPGPGGEAPEAYAW
jgi:aryl-alcohol dehydrogenase-like predicted oxidoreductase